MLHMARPAPLHRGATAATGFTTAGADMHITASYCSAPKRDDDGLLPAIERYRSERLRGLWALGRSLGAPLFILSGRFGLLAADEPIPWYDHLLPAAEVPAMTARVSGQLRAHGVAAVTWHTASPAVAPAVQPYLDVMRAACREAGAGFTVHELDGDPA